MTKIVRYNPETNKVDKAVETELDETLYIPLLRCYEISINYLCVSNKRNAEYLSEKDKEKISNLSIILDRLENTDSNSEFGIDMFERDMKVYIEEVSKVTRLDSEMISCYLMGDIKNFAIILEKYFPNIQDFFGVLRIFGLNKIIVSPM